MQSLPVKTFTPFLAFSRSLFLSLSTLPSFLPQKFYFVLGNEASDIDSIIGSITLAYHRQNLQKSCQIQEFSNDKFEEILSSKEKYFFPIVNCSKSEIISRFDWNYISEIMGVKSDSLIFFDEFKPLIKKENVQIILFDHNFPTKNQHFLHPFVVEVIDHHENLDLFAKDQKIDKIIKKSGSCCCILSEIIENSDQNLETLPPEALFGLLTTILMDTMNFDPKLRENRWVDKDFELFIRLCSILKNDSDFKNKIADINELYRSILNLKYSEKQNLALPLELIFDKDRKTFHYEIGKIDFATIFVHPKSFCCNYGEKLIKEFTNKKLKEEGCLACILLFVHPDKDDSLFRDFLAFSLNKEFLEGIRKSFNERGMKMKEKKIEIEGGMFGDEWCLFMSDEEKMYSRKLLEPIISKIKI